MKASKLVAALALVGLSAAGGGAHAFGNACRDVTFTVTNNFDQEIRVDRFELHSASEGRWLNDNFREVRVPRGATNFVVRRGETVEHAENDRIDQIRVHFRRLVEDEWVDATRTDGEIASQVCVAGKTYHATVNP